jgi:hypothetical protein
MRYHPKMVRQGREPLNFWKWAGLPHRSSPSAPYPALTPHPALSP